MRSIMKVNPVRALIMASLMAASSVGASRLVPELRLADTRKTEHIAHLIPISIDGWQRIEVSTGIVNPQAQELSQQIYAETITQIYQDKNGYRIMLSIAYGKEQQESMQVHKPEICYPAQGFQIKTIRNDSVDTPQGSINVRRLDTQMGLARQEPVTYWITLGDKVVTQGNAKKIEEIRYAMKGYIADGMLVRVSSIDPDPVKAFVRQDQFIRAFTAAMSPEAATRMAGRSEQ